MPISEKVTLHALPPSHPCMAVAAALRYKDIEYEWKNLDMTRHNEEMEALYGSGRKTVPGLTVGEERIHGSTAIFERLEELRPEPALYPPEIAAKVREAELWGDRELQDLGRRLPWGAMHFRPEALGTFGGAQELDPAGTDYAIKLARAMWKYHRISAVRLSEDLAVLPSLIDETERLAADGIIDGDNPTAADLQIGATVRVLLTVADLDPLFAGTAAERIARRHFPDYPGRIPAGAFPPGWLPG